MQALSRVLAVALLASTLAFVPFVAQVEAQGNPVWECDGTPILMRGGRFNFIVPDPANPGELTIETVPGTSGIWNSTAHDPTTGWVYGVGSIGGERTIRAYDANGDVVFQTQIGDPYPDNAGVYAGTVLGDGRYIIHSVGAGNGNGWFDGARFNLWAIDPVSGAATHVGSTPVNFADFSYNPLDGFLYQVVNRVLYKVDPNDGTTTSVPVSSTIPNGSFGASWFDAAGNLFLFRNNPGDIWRVNPDTPGVVTEVGEVGANGGTDGTNCISSIDIKKDVVDASGTPIPPADRVYSPGDIVTYQFTLINNGLPTQNRTVDLCDVLPADGRVYTGSWSSSDPAAVLTSGGTAGDTDICVEVDMPSSLWTDPANPGADPTTVTIDVELGADTLPGELENQATLDFDQDGNVDLLSDDPGDGSEPRDPTTIQVLGEFEVSKVVVGHPEDNNIDEFTMVISCTTASGAAFEVPAARIVDANTGTAWPTATTNGFTISNGDEVRVTGIPTGTTCTTTEATSTAYTSTVAVTDGGGDAGGAEGAVSTGDLTSDLVNDNCQDGDGGFNPFNLQVRNTTGTPQAWETIWRNRPYSTIPGLSPGNYTHTVIPAAGGLFDHVFTGTTPLNGFGNIQITGGVPSPVGPDFGCGAVENYGGVTGPATSASDAGGPTESNVGTLTVDSPDEQIDFTNRTSALTLQKETSVSGPLPLDEDGTFTFDLTCDNGLSETLTITTSGASASIGYPDVPLIADGAECTVSENIPVGWELTSPNDVDIVAETGESAEATFVNERQLADLTISKIVVGLPIGDPTTLEFEVSVQCTGGFDPDPYSTTGTFSMGTPFVVTDLPVGSECTVTETPADGFNTRYSPDQTVEIGATGASVEVTNSTGSLIIDKTTEVPSTHPVDPVGDFEFTLACTGPGGVFNQTYTVIADELVTGGASGGLSHTDVGSFETGTTCTVTETNPAPDWTIDGPATQTLEITDLDFEPTASFVNTRNTGSLTVTKTLAGVPAGVDLGDEAFTVDISCSGGFTVDPYLISGQTVTANAPLVIDDLPTGSECTVTEQADPRFTATGSPSTITIDSDGEVVPLTNTTSSIEFQKRTTSSALVDDVDGNFNFAIVCTFDGVEIVSTSTSILTSGGIGIAEAANLPLVPPGSTCTVTESFAPGWTISNRIAPTLVGSDGIEFTTPLASPVGFENTLNTATLTLAKDVTGVAATPALEGETFTVSVECTGNFAGGTASFGPLSIVEGIPIDIDGLPIGSECTVTETADGRFATTYTPGDTIAIIDGTNEVTVENETSTFTISKQTTVPTDVDPDATFDFAIECVAGGAVVYSDNVSITTAAGLGSWDAAPFLAPGTVCTVVETSPAGWTAVGSDTIEITTEGELIVDAAFNNARDVADLTITKTILGDLTPAELALEGDTEFTAEVSCTGDFETGSFSTSTVLSVNTPAVIPDLPVGAECSVSEVFNSRFQTFYAPENSAGDAAEVTIVDGGTEAGFINVVGRLAIRKDTVGPADHPLGLLDDFDYEIRCTDGTLLNVTASVDVLTGGQGFGGVGYFDLPTFTPGIDCTITETVPAGWTVTSPNPQTITIDAGLTTANFSNERDAGSLTVTKTLDGVPAEVDLINEEFTVTVTCTGGGLTVDPHILSDLVVTASTPLIVDNLPTGAECSAVEDPDPRFTSTVSADVVIDDDGETIEITNTTSTLSITKTTTGPTTTPVDLDATFLFDVECVDGAGGVLFSGTQTITTSSQSGTWATPDTPLLPPGTECSVTEQTPPTGWTNTSGTTVNVTTDSTGIINAAFVNDRDTDTLTINKTVIGAPTDLTDEPFTVDISCTGGFTVDPYLIPGVIVTENAPVSIPDLPVGAACTVTERTDARFLPSYGPDDATAIIGEDGSKVDIDNRTGTFIIEKNVEAAGSQPINLSGTFQIDATCTDGTTFSVSLDVVNGVTETAALPDVPLLPDGTACTVTEATPPAGWTLTSPNDVEVIVNSLGEPTVSFTNTRDTGDLNITKTVLGAPTGLDVAAITFTVDIVCTGDFTNSPLTFSNQPIVNGETITFEDLPTGAVCTVNEDPDPRFATTTTPVDAPTDGVTIDADGENVALVNATGEIMIVKNTQFTSDLPISLTESFDFAVNCGAAYSGTHRIVTDTATSPTTATGFLRFSDLPALPDGTDCTVTEQAAPAGWTLVSANPVALTVDSGGVATATFTNERDTGALTINKILEGVPAGTDLDATLFDVTVTCAGGFTSPTEVITGQISVDAPLTITDLPTNAACSAVEAPDARFATTTSGGSTISQLGERIDITNSTSTLSITKTTTGPTTQPIDLDATFTFDIECTNAAGDVLFSGTQPITTSSQSGTWATPATPLLPPGTECSISENALAGWTPLTTSPVVITTDSAGVVDAAFENVRNTGALTINKILEGVPAGTDLDATLFDVTVTCAGGFTSPTEVITGQISVDAPLTITDLPTNAACSAVEAPDARFATTTSGGSTISQLGERIDITNSTSTLSITKTTTGPTTQPIDLDATFTFDIECTNAAGDVLFSGTQPITTSSQSGTWATPATPLLPPGTECTVTEQTPPSGWTNTSGLTATITTNSDGIVDAAFVNDRDAETLTITKVLLGVPDGIDLSTVPFDITVTCTNGFTVTEHIVTGQVSSVSPLGIPDLPTGAECEVEEASDARFFATYSPANPTGDAASTTISDGSNDVLVVNSTGALIVSKETVVSQTHPIDPVDEFTFTVDCGAVYVGDHTLTTDTLTPAGAIGAIFYTDLPLIPEGTVCSVTELPETPEWTLTSDRTVTLTATSADPVTAQFVNERALGSVAINKLIEAPDGVDLSTEEFEVSVACTNGFIGEDPYVLTGTISEVSPFIIDELPYGAECSVEETADIRFATSYNTSDVTITDVPSIVDVLNQTGSFHIDIDTIVGSSRPFDPDGDFTFSVSCSNGDDTVYEVLVNASTEDSNFRWEAILLPTGSTCETTLGDTVEWNLASTMGESTAGNVISQTIGTDVAWNAFELERAVAPLNITKELESIPTGADFNAEAFEVGVTCAGGFVDDQYELPEDLSVSVVAPLTVDELPVGSECTISEVTNEFFDATFSPDPTLTISATSGDNEVTIINVGTEALAVSLEQAPPTLALTGRTVWSLVWVAIVLMLAGAFLLGPRRRRNEL